MKSHFWHLSNKVGVSVLVYSECVRPCMPLFSGFYLTFVQQHRQHPIMLRRAPRWRLWPTSTTFPQRGFHSVLIYAFRWCLCFITLWRVFTSWPVQGNINWWNKIVLNRLIDSEFSYCSQSSLHVLAFLTNWTCQQNIEYIVFHVFSRRFHLLCIFMPLTS